MAFRAKHRLAAMVKRVEQGRTIKSDLQPNSSQNEAYKALKRSAASRKAAATRRAAKERAADPKVLNPIFGQPSAAQ
jgi:hypothetical protein